MTLTNYPIHWKAIRSTITTLATASLLTACSTTTSTVSFKPARIDDNKAAIYIYRPEAMANALYSPDFYVDDELKFPVKNGRYSRLTLPAGNHVLKLDAGDNIGHQTEMTLEARSTNYIRVTTSLKIKNSVGYEPYQRSFIMENVEDDVALKEITECCTGKQESSPDDTRQSDSDNSENGFSVDKTQNPFSH